MNASSRIRPYRDDALGERESDHDYLCQHLLSALAIVMVTVGWSWGIVLIALGGRTQHGLYWVAPLEMILAGSLGYHFYERHPRWVTALLLGAIWLALAITAYAATSQHFVLGLGFVIILAGVLSRPPLIVFLTLLSMGAGLYLGQGWGQTLRQEVVPLLFLATALGVSWLLWYYLDIALEWSWHNHQRAVHNMVEAQQRRAELLRLSRALDEENDRLTHLNRELVEARREAEEARRLKAEFAANVSHELRTPINLIVGFSEMMYTAPESYGGQPLPPEYLGDVHAIYRSAKHLQSLIDDILDLSRIDAKHMALTREMADLRHVVSEAVGAIRELVERKGLELEVEMPTELPQVYLDRTRIRQVLLNLISNAARFTEQGFIRVRCVLSDGGSGPRVRPLAAVGEGAERAFPMGRHLVVSVEDSGIGIRSEDMDKVFEEFRQIDGSARRKHGGTGLGLAISKRFVELHGGWMWVASEPGQGSAFSFALPLDEEPWARQGLRDTRERPALQPLEKSIVVLDDDPNVVRLFRRYMRGYRVEGATTTDEAVQRVASLSPELLVLGGKTGVSEVTEHARAHPALAEAQVTVLSCPISTARRKVLALGMADYLVKPVSREELAGAIARLGMPIHSILAVEDDPNMMRLLERMLANSPNMPQLKKAYSAEEAQEVLRLQVPDLVLLDFALPGMDGQAFLGWMQREERLRQVPVIAVTATTYWEEAWPLDVPSLSLWRGAGFSVDELLAFTELAAGQFASRYAVAPPAPNAPAAQAAPPG